MTNLLKKLSAIMSDVAYIQKDKTNEFHRYRYASEEAIKKVLHALLVKHGVIFTVSVSNLRRTDYLTKKGERSSLTDIDFTYTFWDIDSGEAMSADFVGTGDDNADKGTYKAITGAIKYIMTSTFLIPTGDDPEVDDAPAPSKPKSEKPNVTEEGKTDHTRPAGQDKKTELMTRLHKALATRKDDGTELFNQGQRAIRVQTAGKKPTIADLTLYVEDVEREAELKELK